MSRKPRSTAPAKRVWRMSAQAPMGEFVDRQEPVIAPPMVPPVATPEVVHGGWIESSFDLLRGVDVIELPPSSDLDSDLATAFGDERWADTQWPEPPDV